MKILIVGSESHYAIERPYYKYLSRTDGVSVEIFPAQDYFLAFYRRSLINKLMYRLGISSILREINNGLKQKIESYRPDILLVFKGMEVLPDTLTWAKRKNVQLVNYNPDNPFIFSGRGSGNTNVTKGIPLYDLHISYDTETVHRMKREWKLPCALIPFGFDVPDELYASFAKEDEIVKACFVGSPDAPRAAFLNKLVEAGAEMDVYGWGWKNFLSPSRVSIHDEVKGDDFWRTLRKYRVQLNIMRKHNLNSHNMRTFEVPGVGGIQLAPDTVDHRKYFTPAREIFLYTDVAHCKQGIDYLLGLSPEEAIQVRKDARTRSVESGYSYEERTAQLHGFLTKL